MFPDKQKKKTNSLFFEPSWREDDHYQIYEHRTDVMNLAHGVVEVNIPKGVNIVLAQAVDQNVNYTLSGTNPSAASGFVLIAGNDPLAIPIGQDTVLKFHAAADAARLELQFGQV